MVASLAGADDVLAAGAMSAWLATYGVPLVLIVVLIGAYYLLRGRRVGR